MFVSPIHYAPALLVKSARDRTLVVADLHLGIEGELSSRGIALPSQMPKIKRRLVELIGQQKVNRLVFLGDVKHNVPVATWQEWRELPNFFGDLMKLVRVEVVFGNHDGDLRGMLPQGVIIHPTSGAVLDKRKRIGLMHGHAWPSRELLETELMVVAHNHPAVEFRDELGGRVIEPVWLRGELELSELQKKLKVDVEHPPKLLVMPAFSELVGGAPVNKAIPRGFLGPMFKSGVVKLDELEVFLLDGTFLGKVRNL